jgi:hypothetical protein
LRQTIGNVRGQVGSGRLRLEENELLVWLGTNFSRAASVASPSKPRGKKRGNGVGSMLEEEKGGYGAAMRWKRTYGGGVRCGGRLADSDPGTVVAGGWWRQRIARVRARR